MTEEIVVKEPVDLDLRIYHSITTGWQMEHIHFHDAFEIYFTLTDNITGIVNNKIYTLKKGDMLIFNSSDMHRCIVPMGEVYDRYVVTFSKEFIEDMCTPSTDILKYFKNRPEGFCHLVSLSEEDQDKYLTMIEKGIYFITSADITYGRDVFKKIILSEILLFITSFYSKQNKVEIEANKNSYYRISPILKYISQNLQEDLSLAELSKKFYLSKDHLNYLFKKATGSTINDYIIHYRILKSRELLIHGKTVRQAAEEVGYPNHSHFTRTFKKLTGMSPLKFKKTADK
jgi:AraC-like DNA-binding protein